MRCRRRFLHIVSEGPTRYLLENKSSKAQPEIEEGWFSWLTSDAEREFRAKLSEVAFAPEPRLALGAIIDTNIGDSTPHGRANLRIMQGLVQWIAAHAAEIRGFDLSRPALPQLDKLTDDQLRAAFRSMDRLAA